jgi:hypothetical protein
MATPLPQELEETRMLGRAVHLFIENYRGTAPLSPAVNPAANRITEGVIEAMRKACEELAPASADRDAMERDIEQMEPR